MRKEQIAIDALKQAISKGQKKYSVGDLIAFDVAIDALEMQIPKKPKYIFYCPICSNCNSSISSINDYCGKCGQKIAWEK